MAPKKKRAAAAEAETVAELKRFRSAIDAMADEWLCPITQELPLDPVTAEDGRVYERHAIEQWLKRAGPARSPATNEPMGRKLLPAVQVRNTIKGMVASGALSGSKADGWKARLEDEQEVARLRERASGGDAAAMGTLALHYHNGSKGVPKDEEQAFAWLKQGADAGDAWCIGSCGTMYMEGCGVVQDTTRGMMMLGVAAGMGLDTACYVLGTVFAGDGVQLGIAQDDAEAARWFRKMPSCAIQYSSEDDSCRVEVAAWLRDHP